MSWKKGIIQEVYIEEEDAGNWLKLKGDAHSGDPSSR